MPAVRLNKVLRELNISIDRAVDFLESKGHEIEKRPTSKISEEIYGLLCDEFQTDADRKEASQKAAEAQIQEKEELRIKWQRQFQQKFIVLIYEDVYSYTYQSILREHLVVP